MRQFLFTLFVICITFVYGHYQLPTSETTLRRLQSLQTTATSARLRKDPFLVHRILSRTPKSLREKFQAKQNENQRILELTDTPSLDCETCEFIVAVAQTIAENTTIVNETIAIIQEGCTALDDPTITSICDALIEGLVDILPFLDQQLNTLAWDIPLGFCSVFFPVCQINCCATPTNPEQLFLSLTNDPNAWSITWTTGNMTATSTVQWGPTTNNCNNLPYSNNGNTRTYTVSSWIGTIHTAVMNNLIPGTSYTYRVGDNNGGWSECNNYTTFPSNIGTPEVPFVAVQIGDMDYNANDTIAAIQNIAPNIHAVLHIGDASYADGFDIHFDEFEERVSVIYRTKPVLYCRGNHELWFNFTAYKARLGDSMPLAMDPNTSILTANNGSYFSVDIGKYIHLTLFNTETPEDTADVDADQATWIKNDLIHARTNPNMTWLIGGGHRPLYCTNGNSKNTDCGFFAPILRSQMEAIFNETRTDLLLFAHMHDYERFYPVYNSEIISTDYTSPTVPIYVVNGAAQNREGNELPSGNQPYSPPHAQFADVGYGLMTIIANINGPVGSNSLNYQFIRSKDSVVLDNFTITK